MRYISDPEGNWIPADEYRRPEPQTPIIMPDIKPYRSMIDGRVISSRSTHREHLRAHGCIEVGNETKHLMAKVKPIEPTPGLKQTIAEITNAKLRRI